MPLTLSVRDLACVRGGRLVFQNLSFSLETGDALLLRGPNGSGKSSLLRVLAGFLEAAAGTIEWGDGAGSAESEPVVAYLGHADAVKPALTVAENVAFWAALADHPDATDRALEAMALTPIANVPGRALSAGQKRRTALARLFASGADVWLLDEPESGLDSASKARLATVIETHRSGGGVVLASTHRGLDLAVAKTLSLDPVSGSAA